MSGFSSLMFRFLATVERKAAYLRGKGYGATTVEREIAAALRLLGRPPRLVLDVGANVGAYACAMRRMSANAEIHMFEPSAACVAKLEERFKEDEQMFVECAAVSDFQGEATLFADREGSALASLTRRNLDHLGIVMHSAEPVQVIRLEDYWKAKLSGRDVDIVKIDVEGHELSVLKGFGSMLKRTSVIQFEFGGTQIDTRQFFKEYFDLFQDGRFRLFRSSPLGLEPIDKYSEAEESFLITNFLASNRGTP